MATGRKPYLDLDMSQVRPPTREIVALHLDIPRNLPNSNGDLTDWRGVACLRGFHQLHIENFELQESATKAMWKNWNNYGLVQSGGTVETFIDILHELDRRDVIQAIEPGLIRDWQNVCQSFHRCATEPEQVNLVSSPSEEPVHDDDMMVRGDVRGGPKMKFDAFLSYAEENILQAAEWTAILEGPPYNLRILFADRDLLGGGHVYTIMATTIRKRCRTVLIMLTRDSVNSTLCEFLTSFAHYLSPGTKSKGLIPILIEPNLIVPDILMPQFHLDYTNIHKRPWFWDKVADTVKAAPPRLEFRQDVSNLSLTMNRRNFQRPDSVNDGLTRDEPNNTARSIDVSDGVYPILPDVPNRPIEGDSAFAVTNKNEIPTTSTQAATHSRYDPIPRHYRSNSPQPEPTTRKRRDTTGSSTEIPSPSSPPQLSTICGKRSVKYPSLSLPPASTHADAGSFSHRGPSSMDAEPDNSPDTDIIEDEDEENQRRGWTILGRRSWKREPAT